MACMSITGGARSCRAASSHLIRVDQNRIYTTYMTVYQVISLPKIMYIHRICKVLDSSTVIGNGCPLKLCSTLAACLCVDFLQQFRPQSLTSLLTHWTQSLLTHWTQSLTSLLEIGFLPSLSLFPFNACLTLFLELARTIYTVYFIIYGIIIYRKITTYPVTTYPVTGKLPHIRFWPSIFIPLAVMKEK